MKTLRLALLSAAFAGSALIVSAGPGPQFWTRPAVPKAAATPAPACSTCTCGKKS